MLNDLPTDILSIINTFNYVFEQKALKCVSKKFDTITTGEYVDELRKYSTNFKDMNIAHKENPSYYSVSTIKDKYNNEYGELQHIWWFGVSTSFEVKIDKYVIVFDMELPIVSKDYELVMSINDKRTEIKKRDFTKTFIIVDTTEEGKLNIKLDEHGTYKNNIKIKKIICIPYNAIKRNVCVVIGEQNTYLATPNKYLNEMLQLRDSLNEYNVLRTTL